MVKRRASCLLGHSSSSPHSIPNASTARNGRTDTFGQILSLEFAVDDFQRPAILLDAVPAPKIDALKDRIGLTIDWLRQTDDWSTRCVERYWDFWIGDDCRPAGCYFRATRNCGTHATTYGVCSLSGTWEERDQRNNGRNGA